MPISDAWVDFIAGWASGAVAVLTCQPVDTVLTRLQAGPAVVQTVGAVGAAIPSSTTATIPSSQQIIRNLVRNFGVSSLWRGASPMISAVPFQNSLLMGGYGIGKQWAASVDNSDVNDGTVVPSTSTSNLLPVFVGGCTGGVVQSFLMSPVEYVKVHQQVAATNGVEATARAASQRLVRSQTLWSRGLTATLLRDGIPHGVWFASYEWCKTAMSSASSLVDPSLDGIDGLVPGVDVSNGSGGIYQQLVVPIVSGAFAATTAWAVGYPFDIIKTRIQAVSGTASPQSIYGTAMELIAEADGRVIAGLYRGFGLKLVRAVPASMIGFTTYEWVAGQIRQ